MLDSLDEARIRGSNFTLFSYVCSHPKLPLAVNPKTSWLMTKLSSSASITCRFDSFSLTVKQLCVHFFCACVVCLCLRPLADFSVHWKIRYISVVWSNISLNQQASSDDASMVSQYLKIWLGFLRWKCKMMWVLVQTFTTEISLEWSPNTSLKNVDYYNSLLLIQVSKIFKMVHWHLSC